MFKVRKMSIYSRYVRFKGTASRGLTQTFSDYSSTLGMYGINLVESVEIRMFFISLFVNQ